MGMMDMISPPPNEDGVIGIVVVVVGIGIGGRGVVVVVVVVIGNATEGDAADDGALAVRGLGEPSNGRSSDVSFKDVVPGSAEGEAEGKG